MFGTKRFKQLSWLLIVCFVSFTIEATAQTQTIVGVWKSGTDVPSLYRLNGWDAFVAKRNELAPLNQRLVDVEVVKIGAKTQYTGVWLAGNDKYALNQVSDWQKFVDIWKGHAQNNLRLVDLEVFQSGSSMVYLGVWREGKDGHALHQLNNWDAFVAKWKELAAKNLHLVDIEAISVGNETRYAGVWRAGKEGHLFYANSYTAFTDKVKELAAQNQRLVDVEIVRVGFQLHYIGIWHSGQYGYALYRSDSWDEFVQKWKALKDDNLRLVDLSIAEKPGKPIPSADEPEGKPIPRLVFNGKPTKKDPVSGLDFPTDMPPINYPEFIGCNAQDKKEVQEAWAYAHFSMWRAYQLINYIAGRDDKADLWKLGYVESDRDLNWSPRAWFGSFKDSRLRFQLIHEAINKAWNDRFLGKKYSFKAKCREGGSGGEHPCYLKDSNGDYKYSANHIALGTINFCPVFFENKVQPIRTRARTVIHEVFHWLSSKGLYVSDTHTHSDKNGALCKTKTEKMYGFDDALHLASSNGCWGNDTLHREMAARNNDNYAYFIQRLGNAIWDGKLTAFPY